MRIAIAAVHEPDAAARDKIQEQHWELRQLLAFGLEQVGEDAARVSLPMLVRVAYHAFVRHLADEEALIVPILEKELPHGPVRAQCLRDEHRRQLAELETLWASTNVEDGPALAARFRALASELLDDMEHEERELLMR